MPQVKQIGMQNSCEVLMNIAYNVQRCYSNEMNIKMFMNNPTMYYIRNTLQKKKKRKKHTSNSMPGVV